MELAQRLPNAAALDELRARTGLSTIVVRAGAYLSRTIGAWQYAIASGALPGARIDYADADVMVISVSPED